MSGLAKYFSGSANLISKSSSVQASSLAGKTVLFYFSASWCPPCRGFTPQLIEFYNKFAKEKNFEVIFVTWDEEEAAFKSYFAKMPWLAIPLSEKNTIQSLTKSFSVQSIPTLIAVEADTGNVISAKGRNMVVSDPEGKKFPWRE